MVHRCMRVRITTLIDRQSSGIHTGVSTLTIMAMLLCFSVSSDAGSYDFLGRRSGGVKGGPLRFLRFPEREESASHPASLISLKERRLKYALNNLNLLRR